MKTIELLAPAKNLETGIAAINCGADAVYIGANCFGARKNASNSLDEIKKLVDYAHKFYVRVHVTINTILNDSELIDSIELVKNLYNIGVDAIIVQDMGLVKASIEGKIPPIQIHMSTQCDNRNIDKIKFFDNIGASRVILARELSIEKIKEICSSVDCEIETFIHGALCVSYSGQCYMSYANGGRSANRGECAQPCRKKYSLLDENGNVLQKDKYLLSLKDFNASKYIYDLIDASVKSFKIEGRLKDINYVKNVTLYYNSLLSEKVSRTSSGCVFTKIKPNVYKNFNRSYTDYFLNGRTDCYNFITPKSMGENLGIVKSVSNNYIVIDADINPQDGICYFENGNFNGFLVNKVDGNKIYPNCMPKIKKGQILYRNFDSKYNRFLDTLKIERKIGVTFEVYSDKIIAKDVDNNSVLVKIPKSEYAKNKDKLLQNYKVQLVKTGNTDFYVENIIFKDSDLYFHPVSFINEIRRNLLQKLMIERLNNYKKYIQKPMCYATFPYKQLDYKANVFNENAKMFYNLCGCCVNSKALESLSIIPPNIELMRTKHCLRYSSDICSKNCKYDKKLFLVDEKGKKYPLRFDCKNCEMVILSP